MWTCPNCGERIPDSVNKCAFCEAAKPKTIKNYCINSTCSAYKEPLADDRKVCDKCGGLTLVGKTIKDLS